MEVQVEESERIASSVGVRRASGWEFVGDPFRIAREGEMVEREAACFERNRPRA
jgi:hypothetical protein